MKRSLPPGPTTPEFLWRIQGLLNPLALLDAWHQQYGDIFRLPYHDVDVVCLASPAGLQTIFTADPASVQSSQHGSLFELVLGQQALVFLEGERHQNHRRWLAPPFHGESLRFWEREIGQITMSVMGQLAPGQTFVVRDLMKEMALRVILQVMFGGSGKRVQSLHTLLSGFFKDLDSPLSAVAFLFPFLQVDLGDWSPWGQFVRQRAAINALIAEEIHDRQSQPSHGLDLLTLLLQVRDDASGALSEAEIRDELLMLIFAGYETTTSAIVWMLYWTHFLPQVKARLEAELSQAPNSVERSSSQLSYLQAVCHETLRIYPVAAGCFARRILRPLEVDGYALPIGTIVSPSIYLAHRRPSVYPDPTAFRPERFWEQRFSAYEYLPFGGGNRRCLGGAFAMMEMQQIVATVLTRSRLALMDACPIKPVRYGITMAPPTHLQMRFLGWR